MLLGVRTHDFGKRSIEEHARTISAKGFKAVQLALPKAITGLDGGLGRLNPGMANYISDTLYKYGIRIAVLGCYINPVHPDRDERRRQLALFKEYLCYARDFGCSVVGTETGSLNVDFSFNPDNHGEEAFDLLVGSMCELVEEAEKFGVRVAVEGVAKYVMNSPERIRRLIDRIGSNHLQVIFDPANLLTIDNYLDQDRIIKESFELFGDRIVALHAKDFIVGAGELQSVQAGKGSLHYELVFRLLKQYKPLSYVLMEDTVPQEIDEGIRYLKETFVDKP